MRSASAAVGGSLSLRLWLNWCAAPLVAPSGCGWIRSVPACWPPCLQLPCGLQLPSWCLHPSRMRCACCPVSLRKRDRWLVQCSAPFMPYELASMREYKRWCASATLCTCVCWRTVQAVPIASPCLLTCGCSLCVWSRRGVLALSWPTEQLHCPAGVASSHSCNMTNSRGEAHSNRVDVSTCIRRRHSVTRNPESSTQASKPAQGHGNCPQPHSITHRRPAHATHTCHQRASTKARVPATAHTHTHTHMGSPRSPAYLLAEPCCKLRQQTC